MHFKPKMFLLYAGPFIELPATCLIGVGTELCFSHLREGRPIGLLIIKMFISHYKESRANVSHCRHGQSIVDRCVLGSANIVTIGKTDRELNGQYALCFPR